MFNALKWKFIWRIGNALLWLRAHGESSDQSGEFSAITFGPLVVWDYIYWGREWTSGISVGGRCLLTATEP